MQEVSFKKLAAGLLSLGGFVFLPAFLLPSTILTWSAIILALVSLVCGVVSNYFQNRELRLIMIVSFTLILFIWSLRAWMYLTGLPWYLLLLLCSGLILSGLLPFIDQAASKFLYYEGFAPRTLIGKAILKLSLATGPTIGVLGALIGLRRKMPILEDTPVLWLFSITMYLVSSTLIFYNVYDYALKMPFHWKPWKLWKRVRRRSGGLSTGGTNV